MTNCVRVSPHFDVASLVFIVKTLLFGEEDLWGAGNYYHLFKQVLG